MRKTAIMLALAMMLLLAACGTAQTAGQQGGQTQEYVQENREETQMETQEASAAVNYGEMTDRTIRME